MIGSYLPLNSFDINGIIRQNPALSNSFTVSAKYVKEDKRASNIFNSETGDKCWHSGEHEVDNYIDINIKNHWIYITNYSIQAPDVPGCTSGNHFPKDWDLYAYNEDTNDWDTLSQVRESGYKQRLQVIVFSVDESKQGVYNKFRFLAKGHDYYENKYNFIMQGLDFWGSLCTTKNYCKIMVSKNQTCDQMKFQSSIVFILIFLFTEIAK